MSLVQLKIDNEMDKVLLNPNDGQSFGLNEGDLIEITNNDTNQKIFCIIYFDDNVPQDVIVLGQNLVNNLNCIEEDVVAIAPFNRKVNVINMLNIEVENLNIEEQKTFNDSDRFNLINFLRNYYFNHHHFLFWSEENLNLHISIEAVNLEPPFYLTEFNDEISLKIKNHSKLSPFNALICFDCSGSMAKKDVSFMRMSSVIDNLCNIYAGSSPDHHNIIEYLEKLKPKVVLNNVDYYISRLDASFLSVLLFLNQKISRGLGERCSIVLYSGQSTLFSSEKISKEIELTEKTIIGGNYQDPARTFDGDKTFSMHNNSSIDTGTNGIYDPNELMNIQLIDALLKKVKVCPELNQKETNFSNLFEMTKGVIINYSHLSSNPILMIILTDGKPEPVTSDPASSIYIKVKELVSLSERIQRQIVIYSLGIGQKEQIDENILLNIARIGYGEYYFAANLIELSTWFEQLANNFSITLRKKP